MPIDVGNGRRIAPNLPARRKAAPKPTPAPKKAAPQQFSRALGLGTTTSPIQRAANQSTKRLQRTANKLGNRKDPVGQIKAGMTPRQFVSFIQSSNQHDLRLINSHLHRNEVSTQRVMAELERTRRARIDGLVGAGVDPRDAEYLVRPPRASPGKKAPSSFSAEGVGSAINRQLEDRVFRQYPNLRVTKAPALALEALAKDPLHTAGNTVKGAAQMAAGSVAGLARLMLAAQPGAGTVPKPDGGTSLGEIVKSTGKDLKRRYGPLIEGNDAKFVKRLQHEGLAAELSDASLLAAGPLTGGGRAAGALARAGKLGRAAQELATVERPALRVGGRVARDQRLSRNPLVVAAQRTQDVRRSKRMLKSTRGPNGVDAVVEDALRQGQVVPLARGLVQRKAVAGAEGVQRMERRIALNQLLKPHRARVRKLNRKEQSVLKTATQYGIHTPEQARVWVPKIIADAEAFREANNIGPAGRLSKDELDGLHAALENPEAYFTPRVADAAARAGEIAKRAAAIDPTFHADTGLARRYAAQGALLGLRRGELPPAAAGVVPAMEHAGETGVQFAKRVREDRLGHDVPLSRPGYWPSEKFANTDFGAFTSGSALRATAARRPYTGSLRDAAMEQNAPQLFEQAIARNFKHAYNRDTVSRLVQTQALPWSLSRSGLPYFGVDRLKRYAADRGIDPTSYVIIRPGVFDRELQGAAAADRTLDAADMYAPVDQGVKHVNDALRMSVEGKGEYSRTQAAIAIPRSVFDELDAITHPSTRAARTFGAAKGLSSRLLLGLSPTWVPFSTAGNALQTALSGARPADAFAAHRLWNSLSDTERMRIGARTGIGHHEISNTTRMGSQAGRWTRGYQEWRANLDRVPVIGRAIRAGQVPRHVFRLDEAQNNAFRKIVLTSAAKRAAFERMAASSGRGISLVDRYFRRGVSDEAMRAVMRDPRALDEIARHVNDFLGDFTSYTAAERRTLQRFTMFYGWLRFSTRFLLTTMPSQRPLVTAGLAKLGQLQAQEVRDFLGGDEMPWAAGKLYFNGGRDEFNLARLNPVMNALTDSPEASNAWSTAAGMLPPFVQALSTNQFAQKDLFTNRDWRLRGLPVADDATFGDRMRVALAETLKSIPPYRIADSIANPGVQGDDSLLFSPRPVQYRRADIVSGIAQDVAKQKATPLWMQVLRQAAPIPRPSRDRITAESIRNRKKRAKPKRAVLAPGWTSPDSGWTSGNDGWTSPDSGGWR